MGEVANIDDALLGPAILEAAAASRVGVAVTVVTPTEVKNIYLSDEAVRILGGTREELLSRSALARVAPEERDRLNQFVAGRRSGKLDDKALHTVLLRPDGTRIAIAAASARVTIGGMPASVSFFWDLTELKTAEELLRSERQRLTELIEASPDGIVISTERGERILYANSAAAQQVGLADAAAVVGRSLTTWLTPEDAATMRARMTLAAEGEHLMPREYRLRREDGSLRHMEIVSRPFRYDGAAANIAFVRDVTERVVMQEQLTRSHRLAALGSLAAGVAHEINNPLAASTLSIELLEQRLAKLPLDADARDDLDSLIVELRHSTQRVASIVRDLRGFARDGDEALGAVDLSKVLLATERIVSHATRGHTVVRCTLGVLPSVHGNEGRLEQVFVNLLANAAQALPAGRTGNEIEVRGFVAANDRVVVEVRDNGPGIAPEHLGRLFDPFFTTKPAGAGSGLGLAITHDLLGRMGGLIEVESELGRGTTMSVSLLQAAPGEKSAQPAESSRRATKRARVLIIDDEPAIGAGLSRMLAARYAPEALSDPRLALARLLAGEDFDLVLCDLKMPGLSGVELYQQLAAARPALAKRVAFMSGGGFTASVREFLSTLPNPLLEKPFRSEQVESLIVWALEQ